MQDNYFNTLSIKTQKDIHFFIETMKSDLQRAEPNSTYLNDVLSIYSNNMIDTLNQCIRNPKQPLYDRFEKYMDRCLNFTTGTTKIFLDVLHFNLECLKEILIDVEYYEPLPFIDKTINHILKSRVMII